MVRDSVIIGGVEGAKLRLLRQREKEKKQEKELDKREEGIYNYKSKTKGKRDSKKGFDALSKRFSKTITAKKILKESKVTVKIPDYKAPSILGDENRFFRGQLNREKMEMFFS